MRGLRIGHAPSAGTFNVAFTPSPSQGGGVILSAFRNNGSGSNGSKCR